MSAVTNRAIAVTVALGSFISFSSLQADEYTIYDAGFERTFELATGEVAVAKDRKRHAIEKITPVSGLAELKQTVSSRAAVRGEKIKLVVYETKNGARSGSARTVTEEVYFKTVPGADAQAIGKRAGAVLIKPTQAGEQEWIAVAINSASALELSGALQQNSDVETAHVLLARLQTKKLIPNDILFTNQYHLLNTGQFNGNAGMDVKVTPVWDTYKGNGQVIAIIDDGLQTSHPDLASNVNTVIDYDINYGDNDPSPDLVGDDHGTACAGVAGAVGTNSIGVIGAAPNSKLVGLRLISDFASDSQEAQAINWSNSIIHIKSNSWGPDDDGATLEAPGPLTKAALSNTCTVGRGGLGSLVFWAGGNGLQEFDDSNFDGYANSIYTISIAAVDVRGMQAWYSEPGANHIVTASSSGDNNATNEIGIWTTDRTGADGYNDGSTGGEPPDANYTATFGGTSSATPLAAGVGALILEARPTLGWRDVQEILFRSATRNDSGDAGWEQNGAGFWFNHKYGGGLVNATGAVAMALTWTNLGPQIMISSNQTGLGLAIPDNNASGVSSTFTITQGMRVEHAVLEVNITHPYRGDIVTELTSPDGTVSLLSDTRGDNGANYTGWKFMTVHNWGEMAAGIWTVEIADLGELDVGTLNSLRLTLYGSSGIASSNFPPVLAAISNQSVTVSNALAFAVTAAPTDGDPVTLSASNLPAGAMFTSTNQNGNFNWPSAQPVGVYTSTFFAADKDGATSRVVVISVTAVPVVSTNCGLIISEYVEGSSSNKAVEIFNPGPGSLNLASGNYVIQLYNNGSGTPASPISLTGTVAAGGTYVLANSSASTGVTARANQLNGGLTFNGNDAVVLRSGGATGTVVDSIGQVGFDPGAGWGTSPTSTVNNTLRRKAGVTTGDAATGDVFDPAAQWEGFAQDTFGGLGSHTNACNGGSPNPDSDMDGMLDQWELDNFGSLTNASATTDFDMDFVTDLHEFLSGTEATNINSFLRVSDNTRGPANGVVIQWPGVSGKSYALSRTTNILGYAYTVIASNIAGVNPLNVYTDSAPPAGSADYRIELE